jgi:hypothetical protein
MPLQSTSGAASYDAFGGGVAAVPKYIEDYFSTFLFTGNASTQTINNGIDLAGKGGLVWTKNRTNAYDNYLYDTARGVNKLLLSNNSIDQQSTANTLTAFNSNGFTLGNNDYGNITNGAAAVSWTWAKAPKFFDVVTYTGNGAATRAISHSLASTPGFVVIKETSSADNWHAWHRSFASFSTYILLNTTGGSTTAGGTTIFKGMSSTDFTIGSDGGVNANGSTYVAYLFAHNAGGFGLTGTDNVISCGSFTTDGSGNFSVNLGYEPQWMMIKCSSDAQDWQMFDNMRGLVTQPTAATARLTPNTSAVENSTTNDLGPTSTGFESIGNYGASRTYIYIAIRRGPMKVPTSGTSVFAPSFNGQTSTDYLAYLGQPTDFWIRNDRAGSDHNARSRLTGGGYLLTNSTAAEGTQAINWWDNQFGVGEVGTTYGYSTGIVNYLFRRAPSFFDEVCYTGTGSATTQAHNLGVVPEMMIVKGRTNTFSWFVYQEDLTTANQSFLTLNTDSAVSTGSAVWNSTSPTSSVFSIGSANAINQSGQTYVAYLFATCAGVSKVGSYTGTATTNQIDCGFTAGSRFVLIKRTDSTGDWYVWDSARGIVAGNDPYLLLNSTAAEVTSTDYIDTYSAGFEISSTAPAAINASGGSYLFLAIA